jgi:hypothetical protein
MRMTRPTRSVRVVAGFMVGILVALALMLLIVIWVR